MATTPLGPAWVFDSPWLSSVLHVIMCLTEGRNQEVEYTDHVQEAPFSDSRVWIFFSPNNTAYNIHVFSARRVTILDFSSGSNFPGLYSPFSCSWIIDLFIIAILCHKDLCSIWGVRSLLACEFSSWQPYHTTLKNEQSCMTAGPGVSERSNTTLDTCENLDENDRQ